MVLISGWGFGLGVMSVRQISISHKKHKRHKMRFLFVPFVLFVARLLLTFDTSTAIYPVSIVYRRRNEEVEERSFAGHARSVGAPVAQPRPVARAWCF